MKDTLVYNRVITNLATPTHRFEMLEGVRNLVVPAVVLLEGVWEGSKGAVLYKKDVLGKDITNWDHKPALLYHPLLNYEGASACDPVVLDAQKVGLVLNTKFPDKLAVEFWMPEERLKEKDERVYNDIIAGKKVEVSTGFYSKLEMGEGEFNGKKYIGVVNSICPDHIAILPDQIGACSIKDGAGLLTNALSYSQTYSLVTTALRAKMEAAGNYWDGYIEDNFPGFVIYKDGGSLFKLAYVTGSSGVSFQGQPVPVKRVVHYVTADGTTVNTANPPTQENTVDKKKVVSDLISNKSFVEKDREWLMTLTDDQLTNLGKLSEAANKPIPVPVPVPTPVVNVNPTPAPEKKPQSVDEYISNAPPEMQPVLRAGIEANKSEKAYLIGVIMANTRNKFTKEYLEAKTDMAELRAIAAIANGDTQQQGQPQMLQGGGFFGAGGIWQQPTVNSAANEIKETPLVPPPVLAAKK